MRFDGKTALITGGGRGIGATTALMMLAEGGRVGVVDMNPDHLKKVTETAKERGYTISTFQADVSKTDQVRRTVDGFVNEHGRIDILVNNAGISLPKPFLEKTAEDWIRTLAPHPPSRAAPPLSAFPAQNTSRRRA
jgi:NAD(P)-dependent dehydrogenase (short-subunit alcohol dehydrogenase family)